MNYLFECAIGPVQEFIAAARRSGDLWYGSWMLSELSKAAARYLAVQYGIDNLIFPAPTAMQTLTPGSDFNVPNKIVAIVKDAPANVGQAAWKNIQMRLHELRDGSFAQVRSQRQFDWMLAEAQVDDLVEFYWVGVELAGSVDYKDVRAKAETLLSARKATRSFRQFSGTAVPKSSLDGARESVIDEGAYPARGVVDAAREQQNRALYNSFGARPAERLSGVDILKRLGARDMGARFKSTSHMAALPFLASVDRSGPNGNSQALLEAIKAMLAQENVVDDEKDGALVFPSRLPEWIPNNDRLTAVQDKLEEILKRYAGDARPQPYYALLLADGDNMGAAIDAQHSVQAHQRLSQQLSDFALQVDSIVRKHQGMPVYSGGDDVLAFLPLHTALACAQELAEVFSQRLQDFRTHAGASPTLSTGVVVAHHLDPLSDALELARSAERAAKSVPGKHGLAVTVSKRSGVDRTITGARVALGPRLDQLIAWFRDGAISAGAAYELQELARVLHRDDGDHQTSKAIAQEAQRVIERKREAGGTEKSTLISEDMARWLVFDKVLAGELAQEMVIAGQFASVMNLAYGDREEAILT